LHARVDGRADGTAEGVPHHVVEPLEELFGAVFIKVLDKCNKKWRGGRELLVKEKQRAGEPLRPKTNIMMCGKTHR